MDNFLRQLFTYTGYSRHEVFGRNFRFLNGEDTDSSTWYQVELKPIASSNFAIYFEYFMELMFY